MTTKITLDLEDPRATLMVLADASHEFDDAGHVGSRSIVDALREQIRAQLPKPVPPEPTGDAVLMDSQGRAWIRDDDIAAWRCDECVASPLSWHDLWTEYPDKPRAYRPVLSPEAVEALVEWTVERIDDETLSVTGEISPIIREFARRLLGGGS